MSVTGRADVAVVIVTYNSADEIQTCLQSLLEQRKSITQQVIVVDNESKDETVEIVRREFAGKVELLLPGENLGFAKGVNYGAKHSNADYVLLLNPDMEVLDHAIDRLVEFARKNPQYGIYGGRTVKPDGSLEPSSCWGAPTLWSMAMFAIGGSKIAPKNAILDPESLGNWQRDTVREVGVITGCLLLAPIEAWNKLGGMDERFFMYGEDVDFSVRARAAGFRPVICPDSQVMHEVGKSSATPLHKQILLFRGKAALVRNHWRGLRKVLGLLLLQAGVALRGFAMGGTWRDLWNRRNEWLPGYPPLR